MPFFTNKFSPKKIPARRSGASIISRELGPEFASRELGLELPPIKLKLGDQVIVFEDGQWISETGVSGTAHKDIVKMKKSIRSLEEENNLLKLKFEVTLDMLTQTTAETHIQMREIEQLKHTNNEKNIHNKIRKI